MNRHAAKLSVFLASALGFLLVMGCAPGGRALEGTIVPDEPEVEVTVNLQLRQAPRLYEPFDLVAVVKAEKAVNGPIEAWFDLPPTLTYLDGETRWTGTLAKGEMHELKGRFAFVVEGIPVINVNAKWSNPANAGGTAATTDTAFLRLTRETSELYPRDFTGAQYYSPLIEAEFYGDLVVNAEARSRLVLVPHQSKEAFLVEAGLLPLPDVWERQIDLRRGVFALALYDQERPTTGYHLAITNVWTGDAARQKVGENKDDQDVLVIDVTATQPKEGWPVKAGPVSPAYVQYFSYSQFQSDSTTIDLVVLVNGAEVSRYVLDKQELFTMPVQDLSLPSFEAKALQ